MLDTRELGRRPGAMQEVRREEAAPADLGVDLIKVPEGAPLSLDLRMESVSEGVLVTGYVDAEATGECGRCLDPVALPLHVNLMELFAYPGSATEETTDEDEIARLDSERADLEPAIRNAIVLALPLTPLCDPDCAGLCSGCGERLDDLPEDHAHEQIDPRWAALQEKFGNQDQ